MKTTKLLLGLLIVFAITALACKRSVIEDGNSILTSRPRQKSVLPTETAQPASTLPTNLPTTLAPSPAIPTATASPLPTALEATATTLPLTPTLTLEPPPTSQVILEPDYSTPTATTEPLPVGQPSPALLAALQEKLGVPAANIQLDELQTITWPNPCFEFIRPDSGVCADEITPGFAGKITLLQRYFGGDPIYDFRSDQSAGLLSTIPEAALSARRMLSAQLSLPEDEIEIISADELRWPNTCAMTPSPLPPNAFCLAIELPGWRISLLADGIPYTFHTDLNGDVILPLEQTP
jgi:hypothetical protein